MSDRSSVLTYDREGFNRYTRWQNLTVHKDGESFNTYIPGFKYDDFNRAGFVSLQKLLALVHSACGAYRDCGAGEKEMTARGLTLFLVGSHYTFSPQLFDRAALEFPMRQRSWLADIGRTSVDFYRVLETADTRRTVLLSGVARVVCVNFATGVAVPLPASAQRYLSSSLPPTAYRFPSVEVPESFPDGAFLTTVKVRHDDIDFNWHSNQASYTAFALECAARAAAAGYYSRIRDDIAFYRALSLTCIHLGQSFAGDDLNVSTWDDAANAMSLHFLVERQGNRICYIKIEFDENITASKL